MNSSLAVSQDRPALRIRRAAKRFGRNQDGSVIEKILLVVIALGGIIALASVINNATTKVDDQVSKAAETTNSTQDTGSSIW